VANLKKLNKMLHIFKLSLPTIKMAKVGSNSRYLYKYAIATLCFAILLAANILLGSVSIPASDSIAALLGNSTPDYVREIIWSFRVPKAITALLAGLALSICGLQMQTLFRNPLADPFILGISAGAGLGVALFVMGSSAFGIDISSSAYASFGMAAAGWTGAMGITLIIMAVSSRLKDNLSLLIFGIMSGSAVTAVISLLQYFSSSASLKSFVLWTMGSFSGLNQDQIYILTIMVICGLALSIYNIKDLNALLAGETYAKSLGVNLQFTRIRILTASTLLAGSITAFCGPVGFIGIAVPHISRMIFKNADHKVLLPATAILGAAIMLFTDTVSQLPGHSTVLPVNTVSALIGIPVILMIILKRKMQ
jgi:iron complex transport system permease protein